MKVGLRVMHYPHFRYREGFTSWVRRVGEVMRRTPGCLSVDCWVTFAGDAVVSTGQWESENALAASFAKAEAAGVNFDYDELESRPREVLQFVSA
jgi:quinol monooxygenase YgiN